MSIRTVLVALHVVAGSIGLLLAGPVLLAPKRRGWHTWFGRAYALCTAVLCASALGLVAYAPAELVGLAVLGVLTAGWVAAGVRLARRRPRLGGPGQWRVWHLNCMGSSVIAFVTAFAVQIADGHLLAWLGPTIVGAPLIGLRTAREQRRLAGSGTGARSARADRGPLGRRLPSSLRSSA